MSRRIRDNKNGRGYGSVAEVVQEANACRSAVYKSLRRGGRWEYTDEDLRRKDCVYYEEGKCRALDALYCKVDAVERRYIDHRTGEELDPPDYFCPVCGYLLEEVDL